MRLKVTWMDRRGAGCVRYFDTEVDLERFVHRLHCEATIFRGDREIGSVYRASGEVADKRVKWLWSFETCHGPKINASVQNKQLT